MISFFNNPLVLGIIDPGNAAANTATAAAASNANAAAASPAPAGLGGLNTFGMLAIWVAIIAVFYFFTIRPQSKRDKKLKEMQSSIKSGDNVLTTSGFFGKVADIGEDCFVIEFGTNRGIRIPVRKSDIVGIQAPKMTPVHASKPEGDK